MYSKFTKFRIPKFNKAIDNRELKKKWLQVTKKPNIVIFEGWCVGAEPQKKKALLIPINELETQLDSKQIWRNKVNQELKKNYKNIFYKI